MTFLFVSALALFAAVSNAAPLYPRGSNDCNSIPPPNPHIRDTIYEIALDEGVNWNVMVAMMATAITESDVNNLDCGDQDSKGIFQQRASKGWGTNAQLLDPQYSTRAFLKVCVQIDHDNPGMEPGALAQRVQLAEAGNRYTQVVPEAKQLIQQAADSTGRQFGSKGKPAPAPASSSPKPKPTEASSTKAPKPEATVPAGGAGGAANVGAGPPSKTADTTAAPHETASSVDPQDPANADPGLRDDCVASYQPVPGDTCLGVASQFGISLEHFYDMNPCIDDLCHNLQVTFPYCVKLASDGAAS